VPVFLGPEVLVQLQVIVEHFLGCAGAQVLYFDPPSPIDSSILSDQEHVDKGTSTVQPQKAYTFDFLKRPSRGHLINSLSSFDR
jgi:hypothetical protein